ncbi:MAG: hypothetical protein ACREOG_12910, partial [Gemmatimonadaceae bacterium]
MRATTVCAETEQYRRPGISDSELPNSNDKLDRPRVIWRQHNDTGRLAQFTGSELIQRLVLAYLIGNATQRGSDTLAFERDCTDDKDNSLATSAVIHLLNFFTTANDARVAGNREQPNPTVPNWTTFPPGDTPLVRAQCRQTHVRIEEY